MDYEKAYKEALTKSKEFYELCKKCGAKDTKEFLEEIFPELKESEDERIKEELIAFIKKRDRSGCDYDYDKWIAWLEKQGEQKSSWSEDDERIVTALMEGFRYHQLFNPRFGEVPNAEIIDWIKSLKERLI